MGLSWPTASALVATFGSGPRMCGTTLTGCGLRASEAEVRGRGTGMLGSSMETCQAEADSFEPVESAGIEGTVEDTEDGVSNVSQRSSDQ